jgi:hypothetical protein
MSVLVVPRLPPAPARDGHREFILAELRCAALRTRQAAAEIDSISVALGSWWIDSETAVEWLHEIEVLPLIDRSRAEPGSMNISEFQAAHPSEVIQPGRLAELRRLLADDVSIDGALRVLSTKRDGAAGSTVDALLHQLRTGGLAALKDPSCRARLTELSDAQLRDVLGRLIRIRGKFAAVTDDLIIALDEIRR